MLGLDVNMNGRAGVDWYCIRSEIIYASMYDTSLLRASVFRGLFAVSLAFYDQGRSESPCLQRRCSANDIPSADK
jgi:hypothetical protein